MKYLLILAGNCLFVLYGIMFLTDHKIWPKQTSGKITNILLIAIMVYVCYDIVSIYLLKNRQEQSGLLYTIVSDIRNSWYTFHVYIQPFQKELLIWTLIAAGIAALSFVLVGMPGGLMIAAVDKLGIFGKITGDNLWPAAIFVSLIWPFFLPAGVFVKHYLINHQYIHLAVAGWVFTVLAGASFLMTCVFLMFGNAKA